MSGKTKAKTPKGAGKENAPTVVLNGKDSTPKKGAAAAAAAPVDKYAELEKKRSAFAELSADAKVRAAAAPPIKEGAVPVGMRRSDKKNRARYSDGIAAEPAPIHNNAERNGEKGKKKEKAAASPAVNGKEKSVKQMKAEMAKMGGGKKSAAPTPQQNEKKGEKRKRNEEEEEVNDGAHNFLLKRIQQIANESMEKEISRNKNKRARAASPSDEEEEEEEVHPLALVPVQRKEPGTPHPKSKKTKLSSGRVVEKETVFEVEEVPYTVEEPSEDDEGAEEDGGWGEERKSKKKARKRMGDLNMSALERELVAQIGDYDEEEDDDFEDEMVTEDDSEMDEDEEESEMDDEEEEDSLVSSEVDEDSIRIQPEDIVRTITLDENGMECEDEEEEDDEDYEEDKEEEEDEDEEEEEEEGMEGVHPHMRGCCDDSDCDENDSMDGEDMSDEEGEGEDGDTSDSTHYSDDSFEEGFIDDQMAQKSVVMSRSPSVSPGAKKGKKGGAAAAAAIDFAAHPFKDEDSGVSASKAFDWLLSPCDVQTFFDDFFQSTSLVVRRNDKHYYGNLFSTEAMTAVLREHCLEYGVNVNVALYENGVRTTHNGTGRAYPLAIGDAIRSGCSVQLTNPQTYSKEIWYLCDTLQETFHCFVGANTYLTPAGASGFAPHWDEIDAFLLQVEGRKYWRVWAPQSKEDELPLESSGNFTEGEMEGRKPAFEGWIEQGDMLYIPRGFIHQARTDKSVHSLHVTISAGRQWTFSNLLQKLLPEAIQAFTQDRTKLRRQLPPGMLDMTGVAEMAGGYPQEEQGDVKLLSVMDRHMSKFRQFCGSLQAPGVDLMAREFMRTALPPVLTVEEKQLSAWGNDGADLFNEKGASRITPTSQIKLLRRHGQRLLLASEDAPFIVHRMANARSYEGADEREFPLTVLEEPFVADLIADYPEWTTVADINMKKKEKTALLTKLFNNGLIMVKTD